MAPAVFFHQVSTVVQNAMVLDLAVGKAAENKVAQQALRAAQQKHEDERRATAEAEERRKLKDKVNEIVVVQRHDYASSLAAMNALVKDASDTATVKTLQEQTNIRTMGQAVRAGYGLSEVELPEFNRMVADFKSRFQSKSKRKRGGVASGRRKALSSCQKQAAREAMEEERG